MIFFFVFSVFAVIHLKRSPSTNADDRLDANLQLIRAKVHRPLLFLMHFEDLM